MSDSTARGNHEPLRRALGSLVGEPPEVANRAAAARWRAGRSAGRRQAATAAALGAILVAGGVGVLGGPLRRDTLASSGHGPSRPPLPGVSAPVPSGSAPAGSPLPGRPGSPSPVATRTYAAYVDGGLRVDVRVGTEYFDGTTVARFDVRVADTDGTWRTVGIDFGDGHRYDEGADRTIEGCPPPDGDPPSWYAPRAVDGRVTVEHAYRYAGRYAATVTIRTGRRCLGAPVETRAIPVAVVVDSSATAANGPRPVEVELWRDGASAGRTLLLDVLTADSDGWIGDVDVDWGDGRESQLPPGPDRCTEQKGGWASSRRTDRFEHAYAAPGSYTVTVTATSRGCSGVDLQTRTVSATFAVPGP